MTTWYQYSNPFQSLDTNFPMARALLSLDLSIASKGELFLNVFTFRVHALPGILTWFSIETGHMGLLGSCLHHPPFGLWRDFLYHPGHGRWLAFWLSLLWHFKAMISLNSSIVWLSHRFADHARGYLGVIDMSSSLATHFPLSWSLYVLSKRASTYRLRLAKWVVACGYCPLGSPVDILCTSDIQTGSLHFCASMGIRVIAYVHVYDQEVINILITMKWVLIKIFSSGLCSLGQSLVWSC